MMKMKMKKKKKNLHLLISRIAGARGSRDKKNLTSRDAFGFAKHLKMVLYDFLVLMGLKFAP